jgi:hypothetical protein
VLRVDVRVIVCLVVGVLIVCIVIGDVHIVTYVMLVVLHDVCFMYGRDLCCYACMCCVVDLCCTCDVVRAVADDADDCDSLCAGDAVD